MISLQDYIVCKRIYILVIKFFPGIPEVSDLKGCWLFFLYSLGFKKKSLVYYTVMKQTVIKFIIEENKQHFSKTCFDSSSAIFSSNWYKVQSWILSV